MMQKFEIDVAPFLPFLPLIKGKVHSPAHVGGKLIDVHALIDKVVADGKITEADLPLLVAAFLFAPQAPPAPAPAPQPPVIVVTPQPQPQPQPAPPQPQSSPSMPWPPPAEQEAWAEEFWHDWFKGTLDGEPESDWAPGGSPEHLAIISGKKGLGPGGVVRLMTGVLPQPAWLPDADTDLQGGYVTHFLQVNNNRPISFPSTADDGSKPRNVPGIAGIVMGPRYRGHQGWDFMVRFADPLKGKDEDPNPGRFRYWTVRSFGTTRPVTSNVVEFQVAHLGNL